MKNVLLLPAMLSLLAVAAFAEKPPVHNVNAHRHPNLSAAQRLSERAFEKITTAQKDNEFDMQGHAAKAKELLEQANAELKQAAQAANQK